ncbi:MAG TPA: sirohydrochlorin chelatase [Acidimicrobiales bacterium]|nr:sirohydrochlorin chelatase [Acidimicrobiales bacterium]
MAPEAIDPSADGLLLVGHGTRSGAGRTEMLQLGELVAAGVGAVAVETGFLELSDPPAGVALDRLVSGGATRIAVVPLMLNAAGHSKSDVPAVVLDGRERHPGVTLHYGRPLGPDQVVLALARDRIEAAGGAGLPLALLARGTSDPDANAEAYKAGRLLAEFVGSPLVVTGFSGVTWPSVGETLEQLRRQGVDRLACFAWYLCTGLLVDRMKSDFAEFSERSGVEVVDAGYLGPDPSLVPLVLQRYAEALGADIRMNCDACSYRRPFPGLEDRVGQELGRGHSHLAAEHRRHTHDGSAGEPAHTHG